MSFHRAVATVLSLVATACGCRGSASEPRLVSDAPTAPTGEYYVDLAIADVAGRWLVTLNGFPIWDATDFAATTVNNRIDPPITTALVRRGNVLTVEVWPVLRWDEDGPMPGATSIHGEVFATGAGRVPGGVFDVDAGRAAWTDELRSRWQRWQTSVGAAAAGDSVRTWVEAHPVSATVVFDNAYGPSFDAVFRGARVLRGTAADSARLRDFAVELLRLDVARDTAALWESFEQRYADEFAAAGGEDAIGEDLATFLAGTRQRIVLADLVPFERADVALRSWSGGRVWELYQEGADGLMKLHSGSARAVYVGEVAGQLRVVR